MRMEGEMVRRCLQAISLIAALSLVSACSWLSGGSSTVPVPSNFPTTGTICTPYTYTFTTPASIKSSNVKLPGWLTFNAGGTVDTISGTPTGNDFGDFTVSASGSYKGKTGTVTATIGVAAPTLTVTGVPFDITTLASPISNPVTITVAPAGPTCSYTLTLTKDDWKGNKINFPGNSNTLTFTGATTTFTIVLETDLVGDGNVYFKIVPTGANAAPVQVMVPVHAHK